MFVFLQSDVNILNLLFRPEGELIRISWPKAKDEDDHDEGQKVRADLLIRSTNVEKNEKLYFRS